MGFDVVEYSKKRKEEEEEKSGIANEGAGGFDVVEYSKKREAPSVISNFSTMYKSYFDKANSLIDSYRSRYYDEAGNFTNDSYRPDYADYYERTRQSTVSLEKEKFALLDILDNYGDYFNFGDTSIDDVRASIEGAYGNSKNIYATALKDADNWSQWKDEGEYKAWLEAYNAALEKQKKHEELASSEQGPIGFEKYLEDDKNEVTSREETKAWLDKIGLYLNGATADTSYAGGTISNALASKMLDESYKKPSSDWTEEQKNIFGSLYLTDPEEAFKYAEETNIINNKAKEEDALKKIAESATSNGWSGFGHTLGAIATAPFGLVDYIDDLTTPVGSHISSDGNVSPFEYSRAVTGGITEHLNEEGGTLDDDLWVVGGKGWGDVYGLGTSIAQSLTSAYTLGGAGTLISYFGQGAASGVDDALARGATDDQAVLYGTALGVFEGLAENIGVDNLFKLGSSTTVKGFIKNILKQAGAEGMEEGITSVLSNIADNAIMQDKSSFNVAVQKYMDEGLSEKEAKKKAWLDSVSGIAFDTIAGAVSGGVSGSLHTSVANIIANQEAKQVYGDGAAVVGAAKEIGGDAGVLAEKYQKTLDKGKSLSGGQINRLIETNELSLKDQDVSKITAATEERLTKLGETGDISAISKAAAKQAIGEKLTASEKSTLKNSKFGQRVVNELSPENIKSGVYTSEWAEGIGTKRVNTKAYNKKQIVEVAKTEAEKIVNNSDLDVSDDGRTINTKTGQNIKIKEISSITDGEMILRTEDGKTVNAKDVSFSDSDALIYSAVLDMGVNAASANAIISNFDPSEGLTAAQYFLGVKEAYKYGKYRIPVGEMSMNGFSADLSVAQKSLAYRLGASDSKYIAEAAQKAVEAKKANTDGKKATKKGKLHFEGSESALTERQSVSIKALEKISDALGVDIYVYESKVKDGKRVFTNKDGKEVDAPNGYYDPSDGSIHIDLYAGNNGEGVMLFTAAHELTHFVKRWSPKKFKVLADFLMEQYGKKGVSVDALVQDKIPVVKKRKPNLSEAQLYDIAYEEVVADSMEKMLADGNVAQKLAMLKQKDKGLVAKIKSFLDDLVKKIKAVYEGLTPDSREGKLVAEMVDSVERLQELFADALVEASENYSASELVEIDADTKSVAPTMFSERTWTQSEYVTEREKTAKAISKSLGVDIQTAYKYIDDINSVARLIADDRARLDYEPNLDDKATVLKPNSDYKYSVDMSTLCAKRLLFTGTFDAIQKALPSTVFDSEDIVSLREMMMKKGYEVACGICYVESTRREIGRITQDFIDSYKESQKTGKPITRINSEGKVVDLKKTKEQQETTADKSTDKFFADKDYTPTLADLNTTDIDLVKRDHPLVYEAYLNFMNARGQAKPKLLETRAEYKGEILKHFKAKSAVNARNAAGGLRLQSFSDFEVPHLIDMMQIVMDMSRVGLKSQAYTKVPAFAEAFGNTGVKINLSLIAKGSGLDANGNLVFDDVEGIDHKEAFRLRDKFSKNVGTILVGKSNAHIIAAMADPRIDYIIPFHKSSWKESLYDALGLTGYDDYTDTQHEKPTDKSRKIKDFDPSEYWDYSKTGDENAQIYLQKCQEDGRIPKFPQFQNYPGYWKLLIDFKMYDNDGAGSPQEVVQPVFDTEANEKILSEYNGGHRSLPVAQDVVDEFVEQHSNKGDVKYSDRNYAPTFYSQMGKVVEGVKQEKLAANSVVNMLRGKGVKAEEIRWSGIVPFLEGKKSVTKQELLDFINGSMLQIDEETLDNKDRPYTEDQQKRLDEYEAKRDAVAKKLADEWKKITGYEFPIHNAGAGLESSVTNKIIDANLEYKNASFEGRLLKKLREDLKEVITNNDDFGFDSWKDALRSIHRHRRDFINGLDITTKDKAVIVKYCNALNAYNELPNRITDADTDRLRAIAREADPWNRKIMEVRHEHNEYEAKYMTNWREYSLEGGNNYREILFRIPNSDYTNEAMMTHWKERKGVLAHARIQDFDVNGKKMLFVEEIQSDWHNAGHKDGYRDQMAEDKFTLTKKMNKYLDEFFESPTAKMFEERISAVGYEGAGVSMMLNYLIDEMDYTLDVLSRKGVSFTDSEKSEIEKYVREYEELHKQWENAPSDFTAPDAPFKDTYHEYVMKRLLREAAENGYDSIGWTTADTQDERWKNNLPHEEGTGKSGFLKGYTVEYDQDIPKFLKKYGKQWGATVGSTVLPNGTEVWSMDITDSMKDSVLNEGQVMYSDRYWYPNMSKSEISYVRRLAKHQLFRTDNYIDSKNKWLYNTKNGNTYFALYSTEVETDPTILYACVGSQAEFEHKILLDYIKNREDENGSFHSWSSTVGTILEFVRDADIKRSVHSSNTVEGRGNDGNVAVYSKNEGKEPSEAFVNCLQNIEEIRNQNEQNDVMYSERGTKTPLTTILKNLETYDDSQLNSLADQITEGTFKLEYESREELLSELRVGIEAMEEGLTESEKKDPYYGFYVPAEKSKDSDVGVKEDDSDVNELEYFRSLSAKDKKLYAFLRLNSMKETESVDDVEYENSTEPNFLIDDSDLPFSERSTDSTSNRSLLANALESAATPGEEKNLLRNYKTNIRLIEAEQKKLSEIKDKLFAKGGKIDPDERKKLQFEMKQAANRINSYDRQLLKLEAMQPIKKVLAREKDMAAKRQKQKDMQILAEYKEKSKATVRELLERNQESRQKAIEGRNKTFMRNKIKGVVNDLNKLLLNGTKERNVKIGLQPAVASALKAINMDTVAADERVAHYNELIAKAKDPDVIASLTATRDRIQSQGDVMSDKLDELEKAYTEIEASGNEVPAYYKQEIATIKARILSVKKAVGNTPLRNMNLAQLEDVYDLYKMVLTTVRNTNKVFVQGKLEDLQQNASATMDELSEIKKRSEERADTSWADSFSWNEMIPVYAFKRTGSKTLEKFFWEAIRGQNTVAQDLDEANTFASEAREKYGYSKWDLNKVHEFKLNDGRTFRITLKHMMSIYAYSKRDQALDHMSRGGFFFNDKETFRKKGGVLKIIKKNETGYCVDSDALKAIKEKMKDINPAVTLYVDEMQEYLTKMGEKGNEVSRAVWGIDIFKEKVYFPLKSVKDFIFQANQTAQESSLKNDGMTKETKPHASNPIVLEAFDDVWANHVNRMSQYHGLVIPIDNLNKVHNYGTWADTDSMSVSTMLGARFGEAVNDYINQFIKDLNGASSVSGASNPLFGFVGKFKKTAVAASTSVVVQQPTAILRASAVMNPKYFVGMPEAHILSTKWNELKKYAPIAIVKEIGGFEMGSGRQATEWLNSDTKKGLDKVMNTIDDWTMKGAEIGDMIGWTTIWEAVKREVKATTNLKEGSQEFLEKAGERFTEVIVLTQVYDSTLSRSGYMRSKHDSVKMLTSFMGEPTVSANMIFDATVQAKRGTISVLKAGRIIGATYAATIAASVLASMVYGLRDDDDDESYLEKFAEAFGGKLLGDLNPLNMLPAFRDLVSIFDGWDVERTDVAVFKDIKDAFDGLDSDSKSTQRKIEDLAGAIASVFGLPLKNVLRTTREFYNAVENILDDVHPKDVGEAFVRGITGEKKDKGDELYDALVSGDKARLEVYRKGYKTEESYETALKKALRDNDPRIKEAAQARIDGDISKYKSIATSIISEGHFSQDLVVKAVNAEINLINKEADEADSSSDDEEEETKATSIYKASDINAALENGDTSDAIAVIDDLVRVKTENYIAEGEKKSEAKKKAESSVRSSVTSYWKELYLEAYQSKDNAEMARIRKLLKETKLYDNVVETCQDWVKQSKKSK